MNSKEQWWMTHPSATEGLKLYHNYLDLKIIFIRKLSQGKNSYPKLRGKNSYPL